MKKKLGLTFCVMGVLAVLVGFTDVLASEQVNASEVDITRYITVKQVNVGEGGVTRVVTAEEQEAYENKNIQISITVEEQNEVENSPDLSGFVWRQDGTGFFFEKADKLEP